MKFISCLFNVWLVTCCSLGWVIEPYYYQRQESRQHIDNTPTSFASFRENNIASCPVISQHQVHHDRHKDYNTENLHFFRTGYAEGRTNQEGNVRTIKHEFGYGCPRGDDSFYRHFDDAVNAINHHVRKDNTNKKPCACTEGLFIFCNCSNSNLASVPQDIPTDVKSLDLSSNSLYSLDGSPFQKYPKLRFLSLHRNYLKNISLDSFKGLENLLVLDLGTNFLEMKLETYPVGVFANLTSLVALRINRNTRNPAQPDLAYPDQALAHLKSLKFISMDGISNKTFGKGFGDMTSLETLSLNGYHDGYCKLESLTPETFKYLGMLKILNAKDCFITGKMVENGALIPLKNLHSIDFTWNEDIGMHRMTQILREIKDTNLKELIIGRIARRFSPGTRIRSSYMDNLPRNLTCLVVGGNSINEIDSDVLGRLPKSLQHLDISGNKMVFGNYLKNLSLLENLKSLTINGNEYTFHIPKSFPSKFNNEQRLPGNSNQEMSFDPDDDVGTGESSLTLTLPPKLQHLVMTNAGLWYYLSALRVNETNSIEEINLSHNQFPTIQGPFRGFTKLKRLILRSCQIVSVNKTFFQYFPVLEYLNLSGNLIGRGINLFYHHPFKYLKTLTYLNLNFNAILHLRNDSFLGLNALKELHIQENFVYNFSACIMHMPNLTTLNLNHTNIYSLHHDTRKHIDSIANVKVYMYSTPLRCICHNLDFLKWMIHANAIPRYINYTCILSNSAVLKLPWNQFLNKVNIIQRECADNYGLFLVVIGATLLFLVLTIGSIVYRFRWRLRYFYYGLLLWMNRTTDQREEGQFTYDVFLSYASEDFDFVWTKIYPGKY